MHILSLEKTHLRPKLKKKNHDLLSSIVNEIGRTDKGQVRESQNITSRFPTVLLSSLMMFLLDEMWRCCVGGIVVDDDTGRIRMQ